VRLMLADRGVRSRPRSRGSLASRSYMPAADGSTRVPAPVERSAVATVPSRPRGRGEMKRLAQVLGATCLVVGGPVALVWTLRADDMMTSPLFGVLVGTGTSLFISRVVCLLWEKRLASDDLLFSDLMLWGYVRRRHAERRLASALEMLGPMARKSGPDEAFGAKRRVKLLEQLVALVENRDPYLHGHSRRVARHAWMIAKRMGLSRAEVARIRTAAALHDLGKVNTPTAILHKPAALTDDEFAVIKRHPDEGAEMTRVLQDLALTSIVRHHHERLDGSGYPDRLNADTIPLGAKIIAVADTFDAITSARPYRAARSHKAALDVLTAEAGTKLDADVVKTFCAHYTGQRTITLWSFFATLPERVISTLTGAVSAAGSAAQMVVVAAVVGATGAVAVGTALPSQHQVAAGYAGSQKDVASEIGSVGFGTGRGKASVAHASSRPHRAGRAATSAPAWARPSTRAASLPLAGPQGSAVATASVGAERIPAGRPSGQSGVEASRLGRADGHEGGQVGASEVPSNVPRRISGKSGESPGPSKTGAAAGKSSEAPGHSKAEAGAGKSAEAPGHNKTEESPGNSGEAPGHAKSGETPSSSDESPGHSNGQESPAASAEAPGHNKPESPGKSGEAQGKG
jgi:hypothetical protein